MSSPRIRPFVPFGVGVLVVAALLTAVAVPVVRSSDWWNTRVRVASGPPSDGRLAPMPATVRARWRLPVGVGHASPVVDSTVVVAGAHDIVGRDPVSGRQRWHYQRRNATLCDWVTVDGAVVAAFRHHGGCTDLVALDGGTGQRRWYRTTDAGPHLTLAAGPGVVVADQRTTLVAYYSDSGLERWTYTRPGCTFGRPVAGDLGVAVLLSCPDQGALLALHDLVGKNERWAVPVSGVQPRVLAATQRISVYATFDGAPVVSLYDGGGRQVGTVTGPDLAADGPAAPTATTFLSTLVTWTGTHVVAADLTSGAILWTGSASGPPADHTDTVVYPDGSGFVERDPADGRLLGRVDVTGPPPGPLTRLARVGRGVVAVGVNGLTRYG